MIAAVPTTTAVPTPPRARAGGPPASAPDPLAVPAGELVVVLDARHVIRAVSATARHHLGRTPAELAGHPFDDLVHPDDLPALWRRRGEAGSHQDQPEEVLRLRHAGGGERWFACRTSPAPGHPHSDGSTVLHGRDVTGQVYLEQRLAELDARHRALLRALETGVLFLGPQGRVDVVNPAAAALLGRSPGELVGRPYLEVAQLRDEFGDRLTLRSPALRGFAAGGESDLWLTAQRSGTPRQVLLRHRFIRVPGPCGVPPACLVLVQPGPQGARPADRAAAGRARVTAGLTAREGEVLDALAAGREVHEIARELRVTTESVRGHLKRLMRKLGTHSQLQTVLAAARAGLVDLERAGEAGTAPAQEEEPA